MATQNFTQLSDDYRRIEKAIKFIEANASRQPDLREVAQSINLSEYHFQRLFTRWAGISPKRFLQFLTKENAKRMLDNSSLLDTTLSTGLSSPGRLHDLFVKWEAVTPGEYKSRGSGLMITYGIHASPYGACLIATTDRGICFLGFIEPGGQAAAIRKLESDWKNAHLILDKEATKLLIDTVFSVSNRSPLNLHIKGTNFQVKVWEALLNIPAGQVSSYESLSATLGVPGASRAVGNALAHNPIAYLIPCHRVIRKTGDFGNYRYGQIRKKAILFRENAEFNNQF